MKLRAADCGFQGLGLVCAWFGVSIVAFGFKPEAQHVGFSQTLFPSASATWSVSAIEPCVPASCLHVMQLVRRL